MTVTLEKTRAKMSTFFLSPLQAHDPIQIVRVDEKNGYFASNDVVNFVGNGRR